MNYVQPVLVSYFAAYYGLKRDRNSVVQVLRSRQCGDRVGADVNYYAFNVLWEIQNVSSPRAV